MRTEGDEISLHNPIFAYYLDTRSMTRQRVEDMCDAIYKTFPKNVTIFIVQSNQPSKIECIYSENFYDIKNNNIIKWFEWTKSKNKRILYR